MIAVPELGTAPYRARALQPHGQCTSTPRGVRVRRWRTPIDPAFKIASLFERGPIVKTAFLSPSRHDWGDEKSCSTDSQGAT